MFKSGVQIVLPKATAVGPDDSSSYDKEIWKWEWFTRLLSFLMVDVVGRLVAIAIFLPTMLIGAAAGWSIKMFSDADDGCTDGDECNNWGWRLFYWCIKMLYIVLFKKRAESKSSSFQDDDNTETDDTKYTSSTETEMRDETEEDEETKKKNINNLPIQWQKNTTSMRMMPNDHRCNHKLMRKKNPQVESPSREHILSSRRVPSTPFVIGTQHRHAFDGRGNSTPSRIQSTPCGTSMPSSKPTGVMQQQQQQQHLLRPNDKMAHVNNHWQKTYSSSSSAASTRKKKVTFGGHTQVVLTKCVLGSLPHESMMHLMECHIPIGTGPISEDKVLWKSFEEYESQRSSIPRGTGYRYSVRERMYITGMTQQQVIAHFSHVAMMEEEVNRRSRAAASKEELQDVDVEESECIPMDIDDDCTEIEDEINNDDPMDIDYIDPDL